MAAAKSSVWQRAKDRGYEGLTQDSEGTWEGPYLFAVLADTQLGMMHKNRMNEWQEEVELAIKAVEHINKLKPKFAIVCGDLVNHVPELYPDTDEQIRVQQVADFQKVFEQVDESIPLVCVCGNHDVGNRPTSVSIERYRKDFGDEYFTFWVGGVCCIVINGNLISDPVNAMDIYEQQLAWFEEELKKAHAAGAKHTICFTHIPWFLERPEETDEGLGLLKWTWEGVEQSVPNAYFHIPKERRMVFLALLKKYNCRATFCGHWHRCRVATSDYHTTIITSAVGMQLGDYESGFRLVRVFDDHLSHAYHSFGTMPDKVSLDPAEKDGWDETR